MREIFVVIISILMVACSTKEQSNNQSANNQSDGFQPGVKLAELNNKELKEISGIAASVNNPKLLWAHNDSGNGPNIFLLDENLDVKLTCTLAGIENRDWEDIAVGPGPDESKSYVYVADIGDNEAQYQHKFIYRFEEPVWNKTKENVAITSFDRITFQLSDTRKDTETLLLDPKTKNLYVVSKREEPVCLYELKYPYSEEDTLVADKLMSLPFTQIVGGDFAANGTEILMKNYNQIYYWNCNAKSMTEALKENPLEIPYEVEPQGESIAWATDGSGFYTLSEAKKKEKSYLYFYKRKP
jgi:hypothetical protein